MKTIKGEKIPLTDAVTDLDDILAKEDIGGATDHSRGSMDLSLPEERNRLLSIRADMNKQLIDTKKKQKKEREELNNWNLKVSEFNYLDLVQLFQK